MLLRWILVILGVLSLGGIILINLGEKEATKELQKPFGGRKNTFSLLFLTRVTSNEKQDASQNNWLYDYNQYPMGSRERITYILLAAGGLFIIGYIFYQSVVGALLLTPFALLYPPYKRREKIQLQKKQLNLEFKEALYVITSSLSVGKSLEMAIRDGVRELELLYPNSDTFIIEELRYIVRKIEMNETVEEAFYAFAKRSHGEDIENFVEVLVICKRTGGNLVEVMKNTSKMISDKIEFQQELDLMLSKRKFEQKFLNIIPVAMVLILSWSAPDYMAPVFNSLMGRIVMTVAILLFAISMVITKKIIQIEV